MPGLLEQLGALGGLNPPLNQPQGQPINADQQAILRQLAMQKLTRQPGQQAVDLPGNSHPYRLTHPLLGLTDAMNALAGRRALGNTFDAQQAANVSTMPPPSPVMNALPPRQNPPVDPNAPTPPVNPLFSDAPNGGANNNTQPRVANNDHSTDDVAYFTQQGFTPVQAAALAHRRAQESGNNYGAINPGDGSRGGHSIGGFQWNEDRANGLLRFAVQQGVNIPPGNMRDPTYMQRVAQMIPPDVQRAYTLHELNTTERASGEALRRATDPYSAYQAVMGFIRPANRSIGRNDITAITNLSQAGARPPANGVPAPNTNLPPPVTQASIDRPEGMMNLGGDPAAERPSPDNQNIAQNYQVPPPRGPNGQNVSPRQNYPGTDFPVFNPQTDFIHEYPDPLSPLHGMSAADQANLSGLPENLRQMRLGEWQHRNTAQYTKIPGMGTRWIVPSTGQTGWQAEPKYETMNVGGQQLNVVTIHDRYGRRQTYVISPVTGDPNAQPGTVPRATPPNQAAPVAPPNQAAPVAPPNQAAPVAPPNQAAPVAPPNAAMPPIPPDDDPDPAQPIVPPNSVPPPPFAADADPNASPLQHPLVIEGQANQVAQAGKLADEGASSAVRMEPIKELERRGNEAVSTREIVRLLQEVERLPNIDQVLTGPQAERFLRLQQGVNGALQAAGLPPIFDSGTVSAAEMLLKLNTFLGASGARLLTNRPTQFDFQAFLRSNPGLTTSGPGRRILTAMLSQMADRDAELGSLALRAARDPALRARIETERDKIIDRHRFVYNGTVLDHNAAGIGVNPTTGALSITRPINGMIFNGHRFTGRTGDMDAARNQANWVKVN